MVVVDEQQTGGNVVVPPGEVLAIRLRESSGSGFRWSVEDADGLMVEEQVDRGNAPGAAGIREFRFRAQGPGSHHLRLRQWRDWEGEASVIARFALHAQFT